MEDKPYRVMGWDRAGARVVTITGDSLESARQQAQARGLRFIVPMPTEPSATGPGRIDHRGAEDEPTRGQ